MHTPGARVRLIMVATIMALVASGCTASKSSPTSSKVKGSAAAVGLPDPGAKPDATTMPAAAPAPGGSPQTAALALAKQIKSGGTPAEAALRTALHLGGITLTEVDGSVVSKGATPSLGISIPIGQLMFVADQNTYAHGLSANDFAGTIDAIWSDKIDATKLRGAILQDLRDQADGSKSTDASTQTFLSSFIIDVGMEASPQADIVGAADNDVDLTGLQSWLIWLSFAGGAYTNAVAAARAKGTAYAAPATHTVLAADAPCSSFNGAVGDAAATVAGGVTGGVPLTGWDGVGSLIPPTSPGQSMGVGEWMGVANAALSLVHLLVEGLALNGSATLNPSPIVRTKGIAPATGSNGTVKLTLTYKLPLGQYANCLRGVLNASGLDFSLPNDGPVKNAEVDWEIYDDAGGITNNPVQYYALGSGSATTTHTDNNGETETGLQGRPQKSPVPEGTKPFERSVTLLCGIAIKTTEVLTSLNDAISAALGGIATPVIIAVNLLERSRTFDVKVHVQVKDWPLDFRVDADVNQDNGPGNYPHLSGTKCNGVAGQWNLSINGAPGLTFTLDQNGRGKASGDFGPVDVVLIQGDPATLQFSVPGAYKQTVQVIPGQFCDHPF